MTFSAPNVSYPFSVVDADCEVQKNQVEAIFLGPADWDLLRIQVCMRDLDGNLIEESPVYNDVYSPSRWLEHRGISEGRVEQVIEGGLKTIWQDQYVEPSELKVPSTEASRKLLEDWYGESPREPWIRDVGDDPELRAGE